jgi:type II secretory pathway predicted ATPase ExeA
MTDQSLRLKTYVQQLGGQVQFTRLMAEQGYSCSRSLLNQTCNHGVLPKRNGDAYKQAINQVLRTAGMDAESAWLPQSESGPANAHPPKIGASGSVPSINQLPRTTQRGDSTAMMNKTKATLEPEHLRHFSLSDDPFFDLADHREIWLNNHLEYVKHLIQRTAENRGMMVLTGDYGAGKSTLLRHVLGEMIAGGKAEIIMPDRLDRRAMHGDMLTLAIVDQLGGGMRIPRSVLQRDRLAKRLLTTAMERGEHPLLVIDEAHDLRTELFVALKRLWDSGLIFREIGILLVGTGGKDAGGRSWGLRWEIEGNPDIREFAERAHLVDLGRLAATLPEYLAWRFRKVGAALDEVFAPGAVEVLTEQAQTPQLVGIYAVGAMREAYLDGALKVSADHVLRV